MSRKKEIKSLQEWSPSVGSSRNRQESFLRQHCHRARISWPRTVERQAGHLRLVLRGSNRDLWGEKTTTVFSEKLHFSAKFPEIHCTLFSYAAHFHVQLYAMFCFCWRHPMSGRRRDSSISGQYKFIWEKDSAPTMEESCKGKWCHVEWLLKGSLGPFWQAPGCDLFPPHTALRKILLTSLPPPVLPQGWEYGGRSSARSFPEPKERHSTKLWN